jgi:aldehyde:ferredoxin oxidoreductase
MSSWKGKAMMGKWFEDLYTVCNALGICFFPVGSRLAWGPTYLSRLLSACTGRETTPQEIVEMGEKIFTLFKAYNIRQGLTRKEDVWPDRFFEEPLAEGPAQGRVVTREEIHQVLDEYYELRGWEKSSGLPMEKTLNELGLHDIAVELKALGKLPPDT